MSTEDQVPPAAELAVHVAAVAQGVDAAALLDSRDLMKRVASLGPDTLGYVSRVGEAVREAVQAGTARRLDAEQPPAPSPDDPAPERPLSRNEVLARQATRRAQLTPDYGGEITLEELQLADPAVVAAWSHSGKLAHLGVPAQKQRGRR